MPDTLSSQDSTDEVLAARIALGDVQAFAQLYDRHARAVYVLAIYMVGHSEAEEITQEVFTRLWQRSGQYDSHRGSFIAWFMTLARNYIRDAYRKQLIQRRMMVVEDIEHLLTTSEDSPDTLLDWKETTAQLMDALKSLPEEQRRSLLMAYFGGLSQSSIARELQLPLGTVKKRIHLGLQKLRAFLHQDKPAAESLDREQDKDSYDL
jgi:RNA polymerase sigma-70 factor, ECF subfamily